MKKSKISLLVIMVFYFSLFGTNTLAVGAPNPPLPIADDSILSQHIKEADGTTGQDTNTGSGVKTEHIQDGAVTPAKIGFYSNVIIVAPSGGDFTSIQAAIDSINPTADNPYLIKVMPGTYSERIYLKSYIHLQGSGSDATTISYPSYSAHVVVMNGLANGNTNMTVAGFTITGGDTGIYTICNSNVTIEDNVITGLTGLAGILTINSGAVIRSNTIVNNRGAGIMVSTFNCATANAQIVENVITGNGNGINCNLTASPLILRNVVTGSTSYDIGNEVGNCTHNISFNVYNKILGGGRGLGRYNVKSDGSPAPEP